VDHWFLVDGIYPPLSHFVSHVNVPILLSEALYTTWQKLCQKDIELFFGASKKKFLICKSSTNMMIMRNIITAITCCGLSALIVILMTLKMLHSRTSLWKNGEDIAAENQSNNYPMNFAQKEEHDIAQ
jgi:hypothetical protein